jgi:transcriptional regulator of acetoin/glycerol metabolism
VICAVSDDIGAALESGRFRRDLFQRVAGIVIELPPLATRPEDVVPLARHFAELGGRSLEPGAERALLDYAWPGNVRELRLAIERAGQMVENGTLPSGAVAEAIELGGIRRRNAEAPSDRAVLVRICETHGWHGGRISQALGIGRTTLHTRLLRAGLSLRQAKKERLFALAREQWQSTEQSPIKPSP